MSMISGPIVQDAFDHQGNVLSRVAARLRKLLAERREHDRLKARRQAFRNLLELDDKTLDDIGFTRYEVEEGARLPLDVNASHAVREMARKRREKEQQLRQARRKQARR